MFKNTYPIFEKKRLLKIEMLDTLRDFPRDLFGIFYQEHANGIVSGADLQVEDTCLTITPGILYWNGIPYIMREKTQLVFAAEELPVYIKVRFGEQSWASEKQEYLAMIRIDANPAKPLEELELGRFRLQKGARLRDQYRDFFDFDTEFDTLNRIHVPFAAPGGSTIWPEVLRVFAKTLMRYPVKNPWDYTFCLHCLQVKAGLGPEVLVGYLNARLKAQQDTYTNQEVYQALGNILRDASGQEMIRSRERPLDRKILLM